MDCGEKPDGSPLDSVDFWFNTKCENRVAIVPDQWDECLCHIEGWRDFEKNTPYTPKFQLRGCQHCKELRTQYQDGILIIGPSPEETEAGAPLRSESESNTIDTMETFSTGAKRVKLGDQVKFDQLSPHALREIAETQAEGDKKYGVGNWRKGLPVGDILNHVYNHLNLYQMDLEKGKVGQEMGTDENHLAHAAWGLMVLMHYRATRKLEELNDLCQDK